MKPNYKLYHIQWGTLEMKSKPYKFRIKKSVYVFAHSLKEAKDWARNQEKFLSANVNQVEADYALGLGAKFI